MTKEEEKAIFDTATEKLDLYMQSFLKYKYVDDVREFLQPGGPYVRFALRGFMKELLDEMIKPVEEWTKDPYYLNIKLIFGTVKKKLAEHFEVRHELNSYTFSELVYIKINNVLSLMLI